MSARGLFDYVHGSAGPILKPIYFSGKQFFFAGTIKLPIGVGVAIYGAGPTPAITSNILYGPEGTIGMMTTRFTRIDGEAGGAMLRIRGGGVVIYGITFQGRPYDLDFDGGGPSAGTRPEAAIEIEGRPVPPTARYCIQNCVLSDCVYGIVCRAGYYDDEEVFQPFELYADTGFVLNTTFYGCTTAFRSENQQAAGWSFNYIILTGWQGRNFLNMTAFDIQRGGALAADMVQLLYPSIVVFRVAEYSQYTACLTATNILWDNFTGYDGIKFTAFKYDGDVFPGSMQNFKWTVRMQGDLHYDELSSPPVNMSNFIDLPQGCNTFPVDDILMDLRRVKYSPGFTSRFEYLGDGPYFKPSFFWGSRIGAWEMDEPSGATVKDYGPNGADGTITGSVTRVAGHLETNKALSFTAGAGNYVEIPDQAGIRMANPSSLSFWIKLNSYTDGVVMSKFHDVATPFAELGIRTEATGGNKFYVTVWSSNVFGDLSSYITEDTWHHVVIAVTSALVGKLYIDGVLIGSAAFGGGAWFNSDNPIRLGAPTANFFGSGTASSDMVLDDLFFFDSELTLAQVQALYGV
jgi:hypothetical protein